MDSGTVTIITFQTEEQAFSECGGPFASSGGNFLGINEADCDIVANATDVLDGRQPRSGIALPKWPDARDGAKCQQHACQRRRIGLRSNRPTGPTRAGRCVRHRRSRKTVNGLLSVAVPSLVAA